MLEMETLRVQYVMLFVQGLLLAASTGQAGLLGVLVRPETVTFAAADVVVVADNDVVVVVVADVDELPKHLYLVAIG